MKKRDLYSFQMNSLNGSPFDFSVFRGKKVLLVNTASACGYTPQYAQMEELSKLYPDRLQVVGIPSNDFGAQEPGTADEIMSFCQKNYGIGFPLLEKTITKGPEAHPLFVWLSDEEQNGVNGVKPQWNFGKYLINERGELMAYFAPPVSPLDEQITRLI